MTGLEIEISDWERAGSDTPENLSTTGRLRILAGGTNLTEHEDLFSRTIRQEVLLSAYPLALWFANNWWRILYEPYPLEPPPSTDWRMAHEMPAVNHGFIWPTITIQSNGPTIELDASPSPSGQTQSVRYLNGLQTPKYFPRAIVEKAISRFISSTLARLEAEGLGSTGLAALWEEVRSEINDPESRDYRVIEACLGYDPDEAPTNLVQQFLELRKNAGIETLEEIAPLLGRNLPGQESSLQMLMSSLQHHELDGRPNIPMLGAITRLRYSMAPWRQAVEAARAVRDIIEARDEKLQTSKLCELLGINESSLVISKTMSSLHLSLGVRQPDGQISFYLRHSRSANRRFELARLIAD